MAKKNGAKKAPREGKGNSKTAKAGSAGASPGTAEMSGKEYSREMRKLHVELVKLQE